MQVSCSGGSGSPLLPEPVHLWLVLNSLTVHTYLLIQLSVDALGHSRNV